jgi:hypothetical protein
MAQPSLHTLHRMLIDPASRLRSKKRTHQRFGNWEELAPNHYVKCGDITRDRSEGGGCEGDMGSESKPAAQEDSSLLVLL